MLAIKAGGSVITRKGEKAVFDRRSSRRLAAALARLRAPFLLVHGTGSFGKPPARRYGYLSGRIPAGAPVPVPAIRAGLLELHTLLIAELSAAGVRAVSCPGVEYFGLVRGRPVLRRKAALLARLRSGSVPVINSDIFREASGFRVVSSDALLTALCAALKPELAVFFVDTPGILGPGGVPVPRVRAGGLEAVRRRLGASSGDVSGGMRGKLGEVQRIAGGGVDVLLLDGSTPERLMEALAGARAGGTYVHAAP